jgi:hypothetical protein
MKLPRFCYRVDCLHAASSAAGSKRTLSLSKIALGPIRFGFELRVSVLPQRKYHNQNTVNENRTTTKESHGVVLDANVMVVLESLAQPVGTFAGTEDRILRIRNGQIIPADVGNQGGGQN